MAENDNTLGFVIQADLSELKKQLAEYDERLQHMESTTNSATGNIEKSFSNLSNAAKGFFSVAAITAFTKKIVDVRGQFQQLEIAFSTMLGSETKANKLMAELTKTAATTPFDLQSIAQGAKQLLAYGEASETVNDTLVRLGNIASGLSIPLNDLVYLYGTTQTQGRLFTQDVRQFMGRGIPLVRELSKELGKTEEEINKMVTEGKIGFPEVQKVIQNLTNEGGQFYQLMEKQSKSLTGQISNLEDAFDSMLNEIGTRMQDTLSAGIEAITWAVENYKTLGRAVATLAEVYGTYKAALAVSLVIEKRAAIARMAHIKLIRMQAVAQAALNAVARLNPYVAIGAAIVGITAGILTWRSRTDDQTKAQQRLNEKLEASKKEIKDNMERTAESISVIQDKTKAIKEQIDAYNELQKYDNAFSGETMESIQSMTKTEVDTRMSNYKNQKEVKAVTDELDRLKKKLEEVNKKNIGNIGLALRKQYENEIKEAEGDIVNFTNKLAEIKNRQRKEEEELSFQGLNNEQKIEELRKRNNRLLERRNELEKQFNELSDGGTRITLQAKQIQNLINQYDKEITENSKRANEIESINSKEVKNYEYWENKKKEATDAFHKALAYTEPYYKALSAMKEAEEQMKKWERQAKQSEETYKQLREKIEQMNDEIERTNALQGKQGFARQRQEVENDYSQKKKELERQEREDLEKAKGNGKLMNELAEAYKKQYESLGEARKVALDKISEEEIRYIASLNDKMSDYWVSDLEKRLRDIERETADAIKDAEEQLGGDSISFKNAKADAERVAEAKKEDAIIEDRIRRRQTELEIQLMMLDAQKDGKTSEEYEYSVLEAKKSSYQEQLDILKSQANINDEEIQQMEMLQANIDALTIKQGQLRDTTRQTAEEYENMTSQIASALSQSGSRLKSSGGRGASIAGSISSGIGDSYNNYQTMKQYNASGNKAAGYAAAAAAAIEMAVEMYSMISEQARKNKQALEDWDMAIQNSAHELAMLQLDEYEYRAKNMWGQEDPYTKIQSSVEKMSAASKETKNALEKLSNEGRVQTGTKKVVKGENVAEAGAIGASAGLSIGASIAMAAAVGAAAGAGAFGVGAIIGAAAGAITATMIAVFAGKETVPVYESLQKKYGEIYNKDTLEINKEILADYDKMDDKTKKLIDNARELLDRQKEAKEEYEQYIKELTGDVSAELSDSLVKAFTDRRIYEAVDTFHDYIKTHIEDILSQKAMNAVFGDMLDGLDDVLKSDYYKADDMRYVQAIEDALAAMPAQIDRGLITYDRIMKAYQDVFAQYDLFSKEAQDATSQTALEGRISSMSEDTAGKLNGNFYGLKLSAMEINSKMTDVRNKAGEMSEMMTRSIGTLNQIALNTAYCERLTQLDRIASDIREMKINGVIAR